MNNLPLGQMNLGGDDQLLLGTLNGYLTGQLSSLSVEFNSLDQESLLIKLRFIK